MHKHQATTPQLWTGSEKMETAPELQPNEQEVVSQFDELVDKTRALDSDIAERFATLSNFLSYFRNGVVPSADHYAATELLGAAEACQLTGVRYKEISPEHQWSLKDTESLPDAELSPSIS